MALVGGWMLLALNANADPTYGFQNITANNLANAASGQSQLYFTLTDAGSSGGHNQVMFTFFNTGPAAMSIADIYFDDGALLGIASFTPSAGVAFSVTASPGNLPGHTPYDFRPEYNGTANSHFAADSDSPVQPNGVNPGETLGILYNLQTGRTYADVLSSLALSQTDMQHDLDGGLRVGIHVQGFAGGGSESFLNGPGNFTPASTPDASATISLLGLALLGLHGLHRRFARV